jgi:Domain of unknown function (DUF4917)
MAATPPDGTLLGWSEVRGRHRWQTLLLGNGLSINVWPRFAYRNLFEHAERTGLSKTDRALFGDTPNFELVLGDLLTAIRVNEIVGLETAALYERYRSIQVALGYAVRAVHVKRDDVPQSTRAAIRAELERFEWIFTTSYDLLLYWAIASPGHFRPFKDHFRFGRRLEFDPTRARVLAGEIPVYFVHGALHLVVSGDGVTWKLKQTAIRSLLDQFGLPIAGDEQARPLLVTEGSARDKLQAIEANSYLSHALDRLRKNDRPLVVFGSSLSEQDRHIAEALNEFPSRPVAISMIPGPRRELATAQLEIYGRLRAENLLFYDASTHPLGFARLRVQRS